MYSIEVLPCPVDPELVFAFFDDGPAPFGLVGRGLVVVMLDVCSCELWVRLFESAR
jgi:hypothetical protein